MGAVFEKLTIGDRIKYLMEVRGISRVELAEKIGISQAAISNVVTNASRKPSAPTLLLMAAELNASPQWILDGIGDPRGTTQPDRTPDQLELLRLYREMAPEARQALLSTARLMRGAIAPAPAQDGPAGGEKA